MFVSILLSAALLLVIALKVIGVLPWSWWVVLLPWYGPVGVGCVLACVIVGAGAFGRRRRERHV